MFTKQGLQVQVLRMDLLHPIVSGNKWMKLQPWLQQANQEGLKGIITKGGPWSNHIHAAAFAAQKEGLAFTAIIKAKKEMLTPTLEDAKQWGANIIYCDSNAYEDEDHWMNMAMATNSLYIPMGGEGAGAVAGVSHYFSDLNLGSADYVFCPVGTGTTLSGIAFSGMDFKSLIGINPGIRDDLYGLLIETLKKAFPNSFFELIENKSLKKFGKWPAFLPGKMNEWYRQWNLPTDIIYTAKMLFIFMEMVADGYFEQGSKILLIHTGGLQGNRSLPQGLLSF